MSRQRQVKAQPILKGLPNRKDYPNAQIETGHKAGKAVKWLKNEFQLGHGHSMAIYALLKGKKEDE